MSEIFINRAIKDEFIKKLQPKKVLVIYGARRVGKTEFISRFLKTQKEKDYLLLNGDDLTVLKLLENRTKENYKRLLGNKTLLVIDEAQQIPNIGQNLKFIVDQFKTIKVIATGSSMFELDNKVGEPLVGRKNTLKLHPLSLMELTLQEDLVTTNSLLQERMIFGGYPELIHCSDRNDQIDYLREMVNSYLLNDILDFEGIRKSDKILDLLQLIAFQIGKPVNLEELGRSLKMSKNTVERYLNLLSKAFVIFKVTGFSRNLRKEVTKMNRWYFYDNGIRNAIIQNFNPLSLRNDVGDLWKNFVINERIKYLTYSRRTVSFYFWRTYDQQELDWVEEEEEGQLRGYELKWNPNRKAKVPGGWANAYPKAEFHLINQDNYLDWVT